MVQWQKDDLNSQLKSLWKGVNTIPARATRDLNFNGAQESIQMNRFRQSM